MSSPIEQQVKYVLVTSNDFYPEHVEATLRKGDARAVEKIIKLHKEQDIFDFFIGYNYKYKSCNLLQYAVRYCSLDVIKVLFDNVQRILGPHHFDEDTKHGTDINGKNVLIIAAKHRGNDVIRYLLNTYELNASHYPENGKAALTYLLERKKTDLLHAVVNKVNSRWLTIEGQRHFKKDLRLLQATLPPVQLTSTYWIKVLTKESYEEGRSSKISNILYRKQINFTRNRRRQLLRYVAFQLYARWKYHLNIGRLEDVQVMSVLPKPTHDNIYPQPCIYIATTPVDVCKEVKEDYKIKLVRLKNALTRVYSDNCSPEEFAKRSERYSRKLSNRIWGADISRNTADARCVKELLQANYRSLLKVSRQSNGGVVAPYLKSANNLMVLLQPEGYTSKQHHAEDVLCDIARVLKSKSVVTCAIFGKQRSCIPCCAKMKHAEIDSYNTRPGFLWLNSLDEEMTTELREEILNTLFSKASYMTQCKTNVGEFQDCYDYDTASDSD